MTTRLSPSDVWERSSAHPVLSSNATHVWRIPLDRSDAADEHLPVLSDDERERVRRFYFPHHGRRYAIAHSALRHILAAYADVDPRALQFSTGEHGKPAFLTGGVIDPATMHFNLSHSGDLALLAVASHGAVGVDVEQWRSNVQHLEIAERFFSPYERDALQSLPNEEAVLRGFFSTWSRKEAYLKATGHGIARGLHHFDVTMETSGAPALSSTPSRSLESPARLLADRLDPEALTRWVMAHIDVGPGYSGALVTTRTEGGAEGVSGAVALFESPYI
ncbi:MAG: 4'-phosphopantetheinyl transferase superfamily protein [Gemmatimonadaceae bacterium]